MGQRTVNRRGELHPPVVVAVVFIEFNEPQRTKRLPREKKSGLAWAISAVGYLHTANLLSESEIRLQITESASEGEQTFLTLRALCVLCGVYKNS